MAPALECSEEMTAFLRELSLCSLVLDCFPFAEKDDSCVAVAFAPDFVI